MISDVCTSFLRDDDLDTFITSLKYYLTDKTYGKYYSGDIRIRCEWIVLNPDDSEIYKQVRIILDDLKTVPHLEKVSEVYDSWEF